MRKPVNNNQYSIELERNLTPERITERNTEKEPGSEGSEEQVSAIRQRNALVEIENNALLNSLYNPEAKDEASKEHFAIHYFGEYPEDRKITFGIRQEYDLQIICGYTKSGFPHQKIEMYVYPLLQAKQQADPKHSDSKATFISDEFRIYRVWKEGVDTISFPHEITKAVIYTWTASPLTFLHDGLAVAVDDLAFGYKLKIGQERKWVDDYVKDLFMQGHQVPQISSLLKQEGVSDLNNFLAGSFIKFLIQQYGLEKFKKLYIGVTHDMTISQVQEKTKEIFGETIESLEVLWKQSQNN